MSLELPGWVVDAFNLVGLPWPGIDEDQLRGWATDLRQFSAEITALSGQSRSAVADLAAHSQAGFTRTLTSKWEQYHGVITGLGGPMEVFAGALDVAADAVVAQKGAVIGAAVMLAGEVAATQGEALVTFGAAEAEVPAELMVTRLIVKAALQELEGQLLGVLVTRAAAEISAHLGGAIGRLVAGGGQVAAEAVALKADYSAMQTLATALTGHGARVSDAATSSYQRAAGRQLDTGGPGGGWREVARAVEQAVLSVLVQAFKDLGHAICTIVADTIRFLRTAITKLTHTDAALARTVSTIRAGAGRVGSAARSASAVPATTVAWIREMGGKQAAARLFKLIPKVGDPVDAATGAVIMHQVDADLAGVLPLVLERAHRSSYLAGRWFGHSWASTLDQRLVTDGAGVMYTAPDGRLLCYPHPAAGGSEVWPAAGARWPLRRDGEVYLITDPADGRTLAFTAHGAGGDLLLDRVTDRNGNRITFSYGPDGAPERVEHSGGYRVDVTTSGGRVSGLSLAGAGPGGQDVPLVRFEYAGGHLAQVVNSSGQPLEFSYDGAGRMTGWKDRNGCWYRYTYGTEGRCVRAAGPGGALPAAFRYEPHRTTVTGPDGTAIVFDLDEHRLVRAETGPAGGATRYRHDAFGQVTERTDPLGRTTRYRYGSHGLLTDLVRPDGSRLHIGYARRGAAHLPVTVTGPDGATWSYAQDERGNVTGVSAPDGTRTSYRHDERGRLVAITAPGQAITAITANRAGLPVTVTGPDGAVTTVERDGFGRVTAVTGPAGEVTRYGWTTEGKLAWQESPDGGREEGAYDGEGNLTRHTDPAGQLTTFTYTHFDLPATVTAPDGGTWRYAYDTGLRLTEVTNPAGLTWRYEHDAAGRVTGETDFNGRVVRYGYDTVGQLTSKTNGAGQQIRYHHDELGNLTRQETGGQATTFGYDPLGRLTGGASADAQLAIRRDPLGRVLAETVNGATVTSVYGQAGRRTRRTTPSGAVTRWDYDAAGRPVTLHTAGQQIAFGYDAAGREVTRRIGDHVALTQAWDACHRLTGQVLARAGVPGSPPGGLTADELPAGPPPAGPAAGTAAAGAPVPQPWQVLQRRGYQWTRGGLLAHTDDQLTGPRSFQHDPLGRITSVTGPGWQERYSYDHTGNITTAHWPAPAPGNPWAGAPGAGPAATSLPGGPPGPAAAAGPAPGAQTSGDRAYQGTLLQRAGAVQYRYDKQGRVITRSHKRLSRKPATWHYTWDADDRLTGVTTPDGTAWRYLYDPLGRRIAKQRLAADGSITRATRFSWDGPVLAEQATTGAGPDGPEAPEVTTWAYQPGTFTPLTQARRLPAHDAPQEWIDAQFHAIITSNVGAPAELVTPDGELARHQRATIWGAPARTADGDATASTPLRFPGQYHDPETGWDYNFHRYYDPATGRYATPDPLGLSPAPNPHNYTDDPTTTIDPLGLMGCSDRTAAEAAPSQLASGMRGLLAQRAGFAGSGSRLIVDENLPSAWASGLRAAGYDARSVAEMGLKGSSDQQLGQLADQVGADVLTRDVGHQIEGGFGSKAIQVDSRVRSLETVLRLLGG